jgi:hypothetical protein
MSFVFQNIDPPSPSPPGECVPRLCCGGRTHSPGGEGVGGGVNILEEARHSSVLYLYRILFGYIISGDSLPYGIPNLRIRVSEGLKQNFFSQYNYFCECSFLRKFMLILIRSLVVL